MVLQYSATPSAQISVFSQLLNQLQTSENERSCATCCSLGHAVDFGGAIEPEIEEHISALKDDY